MIRCHILELACNRLSETRCRANPTLACPAAPLATCVQRHPCATTAYFQQSGGLNMAVLVHGILPQTHLNSTSTAALHKIADVLRFNTCSNEWLNVVMVQFLQLQTQNVTENVITQETAGDSAILSQGCKYQKLLDNTL